MIVPISLLLSLCALVIYCFYQSWRCGAEIQKSVAHEEKKLIADLKLDEHAVREVADPKFKTFGAGCSRLGCFWQAHVPEKMQAAWPRLPLVARLCIYTLAEEAASSQPDPWSDS